MSNKYDKMPDYIISVFNVIQMMSPDKRSQLIAIVIYNYINDIASEYNVNLKTIDKPDKINLIPIFEYIAVNDIELFDFANININDIDVSKKEDIERYVLSHIYYITQSK